MAARSRNREIDAENDVLQIALGSVIRSHRKRQPKLSQMGLSIQAGLPANAVGDLERGARAINGKELVRICAQLGVSIEIFMEEVKSAQVKALRPLDEEVRGTSEGRHPEGGGSGSSLHTLGQAPGQAPGQAKTPSDLIFLNVGIARCGGDLTEMFNSLTQWMKQSAQAATVPPEEEEPQEQG